MISRNKVLQWLDDAPAGEVDRFELWLDDIELGEQLELSPTDLDVWRERLVAMAGGTMPKSMETDVRSLLGEIAEIADRDGVGLDDGPALVGVEFREHLVASSANPVGLWEAELIADTVENAFVEYDVWASLDPVAANATLTSCLSALVLSCDELIERTRSVPARRVAQAAAAVCEGRLGRPETSLERVDEFFQLDRQCERESGRSASWSELVFITVAGVNAKAAMGDLEGVQEVMRLVRQRAEPAGGSMPAVFTRIWAQALRDLDPAFAQMLAQQLLYDVHPDDEDPSDEAFAAAFLLLETTIATGDSERADELVQHWMPLALAADHGAGSQLWLEALEPDVDDD